MGAGAACLPVTVTRRVTASVLALAVLTGVALAGRASAPGGGPAALAIVRDDARHVVIDRPEGVPVLAAPVQDGNLRLRPLSAACGLPAVFGTHAELVAAGSFCRVSVEIRNAGGSSHDFRAAEQAVVARDGSRYRPDPSAMAVRRQPAVIAVGGRQLLWAELWFDVPRGAEIASLRLAGDRDPPAYRATAPARRAAGGVPFALPIAGG